MNPFVAAAEVNVSEEEVTDGEKKEQAREVGFGHIEVRRDGVEDAREDEVESENVGAGHPLAVDGDVTVARGEEGRRGRECDAA